MHIGGNALYSQHPYRPGLFQLATDIVIEHGDIRVEIPPGVLTNGASIPWVLAPMFPRFHPEYHIATLAHDYLVGEHKQDKGRPEVHGTKREMEWDEAAEFMGDIMIHEGSPVWKRRLFVYGIMKWRKLKNIIGSVKNGLAIW